MKKYFLHVNNESEGPFDIVELKAKKITPETPIWHDGLENWTNASNIFELQELFSSKTPPPFKHTKSIDEVSEKVTNTAKMPNSSNKNFYKAVAIIGILLLFVYVMNSEDSNVERLDSNSALMDTFATTTPEPVETYQQKVATVDEIEKSEPRKFLTSDGTYKVALFKKIKIFGSISNSATVATYKDVVIQVKYYSKSNTVLHKKEFTVYDVFPPSSTKNYEWKVNNYENVATINWKVIGAVAQ